MNQTANTIFDVWTSTPYLDQVAQSVTVHMLGLASGLIMGLIALKLAYDYLMHALRKASGSEVPRSPFNLVEVARLFTLVIILSLYPQLNSSFTQMFRYLNQYSRMDLSDSQLEEYQRQWAMVNDAIQNESFNGDVPIELDNPEGEVTESNEPPEYSVWKMLRRLSIGNIIALALNAVFAALTGFIFFSLASYIKIVLMVLMAIGPLAIMTSVIWKNKFVEDFLSVYLNTGLSFVVLNILNYLVLKNLGGIFSTLDVAQMQYETSPLVPGSDESMIWKSLAFNIAIIGSYLSAFRLTSVWIGKPLAGAIVSKGLAFTGMLAGMAVGAAAGIGAAKGASAGSTAGSGMGPSGGDNDVE